MADFTSVASGNWADGATWGNTSPGTAGVDYPGADLDTATIVAGHIVSYDLGDSTVNFGSVTVNGKLSFPTASNSTLRFDATGVLTVNAGGELEIGTSSAPIGAAYHAKIYWAQGTAARYVFVTNDGAIINIYGDPAYYSATRKLTLAADWDASAGDTLYVQGDQTATWPVGAKFYLNKGYASGTYATSTSYQTDADIFEIASIGAYDSANDQTPITVVAGHGSTLLFLAGQQPLIISRNVELGDPSAPMEVYGYKGYYEYIQWDFNQSSDTLVNLSNCILFGWDRAIDGGSDLYASDIVIALTNIGMRYGSNHQVTGDFVSNYIGVYSGSNHQVTGDFVSNNAGINSGTNHQVTCNFVSNNAGINSGTNHQVTCNFVSNNSGVYYGTNHQVTGNFVSNNSGVYYGTNHQVTGNFVSNTAGINYGTNHQVTGDFVSNTAGINYGTNHQVTGDFVSNTAGINYGTNHQVTGSIDTISQSSQSTKMSTFIEHSNVAGVFKELYVTANCGVIDCLHAADTDWASPPSGSTWELQMLPNSYCDGNSYPGWLQLCGNRKVAVWTPTTVTSVGFNIHPVGWTAELTEAEIRITASYLDAASGGSRTEATTATATFTNGVWSVCSAPITPAQDGIVYLNIELGAYESGAYVLIDPEPVVA